MSGGPLDFTVMHSCTLPDHMNPVAQAKSLGRKLAIAASGATPTVDQSGRFAGRFTPPKHALRDARRFSSAARG
jgi:hypothetical protein